MRGFLIDPAARQITELDYRGGDDPKAICALIGADCLDSGTLGRFAGVLCVAMVADDGLLKPNACFRFEGYLQPLAGKALILGCNNEGRTIACPLTLEQVQSRVHWVDQAHALAKVRADQAISAAYYRSMGCEVETEQGGLVNVITPGGAA